MISIDASQNGDKLYVAPNGLTYDTLLELLQANSTEELITLLAEGHAAIYRLAEDYFYARFKVDQAWTKKWDGWDSAPGIDSIEFEEGDVEISCSSRECGRGCCGSTYCTFNFPLSYLWLDQTAVLADMAEKQSAATLRAKELTRLADIERKARLEKEERATLAKLNKKYATG